MQAPATLVALAGGQGAAAPYWPALPLNSTASLRQRRAFRSQTCNTGLGMSNLTRREREVLALIVGGKSTKQVAAELGIAFRTAVTHRYRLHTKLHVRNVVELISKAAKMGLIDPFQQDESHAPPSPNNALQECWRGR